MSVGENPSGRLRGRAGVSGWSPADAEAHLRSLELFGMRFGLERMRRLMTALGSPQRALPAVHVVGTNGKSSTTRMTAAILSSHGLRAGTYLSPHLTAYTERIQVGGRDIEPERFAKAVERAARASEHVNRTLAEDDHVTQFELLTAAALWELARREVDVAVIEAGLGGRFDATSVIEAPVCVLTNVGLEHTRWLGPTVGDIAQEKLAVLPPGATLVLGPAVSAEVLALARAVVADRRGRLVRVSAEAPAARAVAQMEPAFQRRNFMVASAAAECHLAHLGVELRAVAVETAAARATVPGRFEVLCQDPLTVFDGAHNPEAATALAEALAAMAAGRELGLVLGVLEDKDAVGMLRALLPLCSRAWFTAPPGTRALPPATLLSLARQIGFENATCEPRPARALQAAQRWAEALNAHPAGRQSERAMVLATGSIYLIGELLRDLRGASTQPGLSGGMHER